MALTRFFLWARWAMPSAASCLRVKFSLEYGSSMSEQHAWFFSPRSMPISADPRGRPGSSTSHWKFTYQWPHASCVKLPVFSGRASAKAHTTPFERYPAQRALPAPPFEFDFSSRAFTPHILLADFTQRIAMQAKVMRSASCKVNQLESGQKPFLSAPCEQTDLIAKVPDVVHRPGHALQMLPAGR